jgi:hypothetical protein
VDESLATGEPQTISNATPNQIGAMHECLEFVNRKLRGMEIRQRVVQSMCASFKTELPENKQGQFWLDEDNQFRWTITRGEEPENSVPDPEFCRPSSFTCFSSRRRVVRVDCVPVETVLEDSDSGGSVRFMAGFLTPGF